MWNISRKRVLITGGAGGIGRSLALELARRKAHLCLVDMDEAGLEETAQRCREEDIFVTTLSIDLRDTQAPQVVQKHAQQELRGLDILVNNAGRGCYGALDKLPARELEELLAVNLLVPVSLTKSCLPMLLSERRSHVLNIASMYGLFPTPRSTVYHTSKYGLVGFSLSLRAEYARFGLGVSAVCPGFVRTNLFQNMIQANNISKEPPSWISTTPEVVAKKSIRAIERNSRLIRVTAAATLGDWTYRYFPGLVNFAYGLERLRPHAYALAAEQNQKAGRPNSIPLGTTGTLNADEEHRKSG